MIPNITKGRGITGAIAYAMGEGNDKETNTRKEKPANENGRAKFSAGRISGLRSTARKRSISPVA